jgi:hypothetical protein
MRAIHYRLIAVGVLVLTGLVIVASRVDTMGAVARSQLVYGELDQLHSELVPTLDEGKRQEYLQRQEQRFRNMERGMEAMPRYASIIQWLALVIGGGVAVYLFLLGWKVDRARVRASRE